MGTEPLGLTSPCLLQWKAPIPPWNPCFLQSKILQGFTTARPAGCLLFISSCYPGLFSPGGWTSLLKLLYISPVLGIASGSKNLLRDKAPEESAQHGPSTLPGLTGPRATVRRLYSAEHWPLFPRLSVFTWKNDFLCFTPLSFEPHRLLSSLSFLFISTSHFSPLIRRPGNIAGTECAL